MFTGIIDTQANPGILLVVLLIAMRAMWRLCASNESE
jgi:hypothetical protein